MKIEELEKELNRLKVKKNEYSLNGELKPDAIILFSNYSKWEVFYLDERGGRNDEYFFTSEDEACQYIYDLFLKNIEVKKKFML